MIICFQISSFGQDFKKSKTLTLSKINRETIETPDGEELYLRTIYLKDSNYRNLKEFTVNLDSYDDEYSYVEEITETQLKNIHKIVKVTIEHCACDCNSDNYYWLVTNENEWVELPTLEQGDIDIGNTYQEYIFPKESIATIELVEFRERINENKPNKNNLVGFDIERTYEKKLKDLTWNGSELQGLQEKYVVTAQNGLLVRNEPNVRGNKNGKLYFGAQVTVVAQTKFSQTITDNGKEIEGNWVKVEFENFPIQISNNATSNKDSGYVFDGYLERKQDQIDRITNEILQFEEFENLRINDSIAPNYLKGDFFNDGIEDVVVFLEDNEGEGKIGFIDYGETSKVHLLGNKNDPFNITNYNWVGIFQKVNKGDVLWSNYEDDFVNYDDVPENKKVRLEYNALFIHASESCGGGFIYWKNETFNWLQQE